MKNDRKNVSNMVLAIACVVLFAVTAIYCVPRFSLLSSNALTATVASVDKHRTSGYAVLKVDEAREDGGTIFFHYYYPGSKSHLKQDEKVLVSGNITFMDESTEQGVNADLVIGTKTPVLIFYTAVILGLVVALIGGYDGGGRICLREESYNRNCNISKLPAELQSSQCI